MKHKCYLLIKDSKCPWDCSASPVVENVFNKIMSSKGVLLLKWIVEIFIFQSLNYTCLNNQLWAQLRRLQNYIKINSRNARSHDMLSTNYRKNNISRPYLGGWKDSPTCRHNFDPVTYINHAIRSASFNKQKQSIINNKRTQKHKRTKWRTQNLLIRSATTNQ